MPYVTFNADFDFDPRYGVTIAYKAGYSGDVTTACIEAAGDKITLLPRPEGERNGISSLIKRKTDSRKDKTNASRQNARDTSGGVAASN